MSFKDPKGAGLRLNQARRTAGLSRAQLAVRRGVSPSTVAANENGQNGLTPRSAAAYADILKVRPEWLMYGDATEYTGQENIDERGFISGTRQIPVIGSVSDKTWAKLPEEGKPVPWLYWLPVTYELVSDGDAIALEIDRDLPGYRKGPGSFVICAPPMDRLVSDGDHIVTTRVENGFVQYGLSLVRQEKRELAAYSISDPDPYRSVIDLSEVGRFTVSPTGAGHAPASLDGIVVCSIWMKDFNPSDHGAE